MEQTERLYATRGDLFRFSAVVRQCLPREAGDFAVLLDRTAFFPGGGGQLPDVGVLTADGKTVRVTGGDEQDGQPYCLTDAPLLPGTAVTGEVDAAVRFPRMQNHTGEHIFSGIAHRRFGVENVGFHMGTGGVTVDLSGPLTMEDLLGIEAEANRVITDNRPVTVSFPRPEELPSLTYRSKLELTENVRLVTVEDCDVCACCAPHVARTGEVGCLKVLDAIRYKGGTRLHLLCGRDAMADYEARRAAEAELTALLKTPREELNGAVQRLLCENETLRGALRAARCTAMEARAAAEAPTEGNLLCIESEADADSLRAYANAAARHCARAVAVSGMPGAYRYVIVSQRFDLRSEAAAINAALHGRGGGSASMLSGTFACTQTEIEAYFRMAREER